MEFRGTDVRLGSRYVLQRLGRAFLALVFDAQGRAIGDFMQPRSECSAPPNRARVAHQGQEGGLQHVFGVVPVSQDSSADTQYHRSVALDENFKRCLFALAGKAFEQLRVVQSALALPRDDSPQTPKDRSDLRFHALAPLPL